MALMLTNYPKGRYLGRVLRRRCLWQLGMGPPSATPIGQNGLRRFAPDLTIQWRFPSADPFGYLIDCDALNVAGEDVWTCYYTDWPVVRVRK